MDIKEVIGIVGDKISDGTAWIIKFLGQQGVNLSNVAIATKIITIIILLSLLFLVIKFAETLKPTIKFSIIALLIILIVCVGFSFV